MCCHSLAYLFAALGQLSSSPLSSCRRDCHTRRLTGPLPELERLLHASGRVSEEEQEKKRKERADGERRWNNLHCTANTVCMLICYLLCSFLMLPPQRGIDVSLSIILLHKKEHLQIFRAHMLKDLYYVASLRATRANIVLANR